MTREDAARKVRGLLAMAADNSGATPAEKTTARTIANHLIKKHELDRPVVQSRIPKEFYVRIDSSGFYFTEA